MRNSKAITKLDKVLASHSITPEGKQWLIAALDPFHDTKINCDGYPDRSSGNSIVQIIKRTATITVPPDFAVGNWNASFVLDNDMIPANNRLFQHAYQILHTEDQTAILPTGGLTYVLTPGNSIDLYTSATQNHVGYLSLGEDYQQSRFRVIGMGFEVANTTAEIYKQGAVCVWEQTGSGIAPTTMQQLPVDAQYPVPVSIDASTRPPPTISQALLLGGAQQWAAAEGVYCVSTMSNMDNPARYADYAQRGMYVNETEHREYSPMWTRPAATAELPPPGGTINIPFPGGEARSFTIGQHRLTPFNPKGAYFTGLSYQTTLTVNVNYIIETFPTSLSPLITLATPSPCLDPRALEIYSHVVCRLPPGVRFADNGLGDFFLGIVDTIADIVTTIGRPLVAVAGEYQKYRQQQQQTKTGAGSTWNTDGKTKALLPVPKKR